MKEIKNMGFVPALRKGNTGIGFTLETLLGIRENNYSKGDFIDNNEYHGILFELKSQRHNKIDPRKKIKNSKSSHLISLVTQAPHGGLSNRGLIVLYGYADSKARKRKNLYATISATKYIESKHKFVAQMKIKRKGNRLYLLVADKKVAHVNLNRITHKLENLLIIRADVEWRKCGCRNAKAHSGKYHEFFHFNKPCIYTGFNQQKFYQLIDDGSIYYDLRMHIPEGEITGKENYDIKHDHGTGFRTKFENISKFYDKERIL